MLRPRKRLGQHFLADPNTARKIVDALRCGPDDPVVEIGPGTGALTVHLADRFRNVTAIEVDPRAASLIRERHPDIRLHEADVLTVDWRALSIRIGGPLHVIGNLPYNITSPILFSLIDAESAIDEAVVMTQYEVAKRIVAVPGTKSYGILSVALQLACRPELLFPVSPTVFRPRPDVRSAVLHLDFAAAEPDGADRDFGAAPEDALWTRKIVRTAFNQRRKTLSNSLKSLTEPAGKTLPGEFARKRAEELAPGDFVRLARYLQAGR